MMKRWQRERNTSETFIHHTPQILHNISVSALMFADMKSFFLFSFSQLEFYIFGCFGFFINNNTVNG